jgi:hypothetical protein
MALISYDTVSEAVTGLRNRGFSVDFNLLENCLVCDNRRYEPDDFEITEVYRFEGDSDPADEAIVYGIESTNGVKGILVNGYGISAEGLTARMADKLKVAK